MDTTARRLPPFASTALSAAAIVVAAAIAIASAIAATPQSAARGAGGVIPFTPDRWALGDGIAVIEHRGVQAIRIPQSQARVEALLKDVTFSSGTIEFDVEGTHPMGPAIAFR